MSTKRSVCTVWKTCCLGVLVCGWLAATVVAADSRVEDIPDDWSPTGLHLLNPVKAVASSYLDGGYEPSRAIDRNRGTKWVGTTAPSSESPQWITIQLLGPQEVSAVAVFGERVKNDGVLDAQIQVSLAERGEFSTVAVVKNARSRQWLASFDSVKTSAVRLLITRSGGPTTHTDIYEIMVFGRPLSPEELKAHAVEHFGTCSQRVKNLMSEAKRFTSDTGSVFAVLATRIAQLERQLQALSERYNQWDALDVPARRQLVTQIEQLEHQGEQLARWLEPVAAEWPAKAKDIASVRQAAADIAEREKVVVHRIDSQIHLISNKIVIRFDEGKSTWDATWIDPDAALRGARFQVEVDGQTLRPDQSQIKVERLEDTLGVGVQIRERWGKEVQVEHVLRVVQGRPAVVIAGSITNRTDHDISLGSVQMVNVAAENGGWWYAGQLIQSPGAVYVGGSSFLSSRPVSGTAQTYSGTGVLALAHQDPPSALTIGYLTALEARPTLRATFRPAEGGKEMLATLPFLGRKLRPGAKLSLDEVVVSAYRDPYEALEQYGDAVATVARYPVRKGPTALWCSWYAHRMGMTEDLVLANAAVAAEHFKPLGFEIMQLDHGWERGDVTGDWVANKRFPHGLKWLADQLRSRYGLRLGVWIAPTDVAETSQTFKEHSDWMLKDANGKPRVNWRWYWKPNPNCFELDASHPEAEKFIEETFARLSADGVSYYKIDFIAASGGEHFHQHDPYCTRGWGVLRRAMDALRRGAGPKAWIRYCQTPPLLSVGLADSTIGGPDTSDAGLRGNIDELRVNAGALAAGWWLNDRLYHREVCDMSVSMLAGVEEVRMRLAIITLAGCSVSFSDELQYLPPSRIRMMQRCLPPGGPPMRPLDLFQRGIPSIWHLHCKNDADEWDVVGLFNFETEPEERSVDLRRLGLSGDTVVFECWERKLLGIFKDRITVELPPQSSRILYLRPLAGRPQIVGTDMHLLGGYHEIQRLAWDAKKCTLSGRYQRAPGIPGRAYIYLPAEYFPHFDFPLRDTSARLTYVEGNLWMQEVEFREATCDWSIPFDGPSQ